VRKLKLQVQTTIDGYMAGPHGEMDWMTFPWTEDISAYINALTEPVDTIVLGRKLAEGFIPAWEAGPPGEDQAAIDRMNNTPKVVITDSLTESPWKNTTVAGGDLSETINELKSRDGGDMIVYGGSALVSGLIACGLVDELHLFVNPNAIGDGLPVFANLDDNQQFRVVDVQPFDCGITAMVYAPKGD
jgi:dihydrofolate reductase